MSIELLKHNILKNAQLDNEELQTFCDAFHPKSIAKKQYLLTQGEICKFEGFVTKGCFRVFTLDEDGKEHVLYFATKDWWITDIDSFTNQKPSFLTIQALEDSEVLLIDHADKEHLYEQIPQVEKLFRVMTQKTLVSLQRRMIANLSQTADDRYLNFIEKYPEIAQKLTNLQLASYLGISHEFLSKIRSKISSK
ncbi:Crp/Fnr family transcriptional regulator [Zobellia nedashkovskayae]|uniref:Crp/Fnr family transcriptional regulator n=1 Tax=Zobellia nedashkovskayae TaxID=2779510 RepID=UPI00188B9002|nr:Crp/Fnr family transcriptional regulator [Zobellia nedashkovskayae]